MRTCSTEDERTQAGRGDPAPVDALATLKQTLARQYAVATVHNRRINQRRTLLRSIAGVATLAAVLSMILLAVTVFGYTALAE